MMEKKIRTNEHCLNIPKSIWYQSQQIVKKMSKPNYVRSGLYMFKN